MNDRVPELDVLAGPVQGEETALAEMRAGVLRRIRRRPQWPVWLAAAAMVVVALLAGWVARRLNAPLPSMTYALHAPAAPEVHLSPGPVVRAHSKRPVKVQPAEEHVVVRLETDDPNVVILWITD